MATKITFACPECGATLSVSDRSKLGKKIKCPKCQEIFTPEVPEEDDDLDQVQMIEDDDEEMDDEPSPRRKSAGGKPKKGAASGGNSKGLLIGGGIVALLAIVGAGLHFSGALGGNNAAPIQNETPQPVVVVAPPAQPAPVATPTEPAPTQPAPSTPVVAPPATEAVAATPSAPPAVKEVPATTSSQPVAATPKPETKLSLQEKMLGLRWMPAETELIVHYKVSEILQAPLLKGAAVGPVLANGLEEVKKTTGINPEDIESITMAAGGLVDKGIRQAKQVPGTSGQLQEGDQILFIVKMKKPMELSEIAAFQPGSVIKEKDGKSYAETAQEGLPPQAVWLPTPNLAIGGTLKEVFATMERGETVTPRVEFQSIDQTQHVVVAAIVPDFGSDPRLKEFESNPIVAQIQSVIKPYDLKMLNIGLTIKGGFNLHVSGLSNNDQGVKATKAGVDANLGIARLMFNNYKQTAPPLIAELGDMLLTNLKVEEKGNLVKVSTSIPDSAKDKLEQLPAIVMMMAMTGAFGGLPGESVAIEPKTVEGLDEGMKIAVKSGWNPLSVADADGNLMQPIDVVVDLTGPDIERICAATEINATTAKLEGAGKLKRSKFGVPEDSEAALMFQSFDANNPEHPPGTLRVKFTAEAPSTGATKLVVFEGSFKYLTAKDSKQKTIEDAPGKASRLLKDEELKAADVRLRRSHTSVSPATLSLSSGKGFFISNVKGGPGDVLVWPDFEKDRTIQKIYSMDRGGKFRDDLELTFTLHSDVEEHEIKFRFEDVPLPSPDSKPRPTQITEADLAAAAAAAAGKPDQNKPVPNGKGKGRRPLADPQDVD